ncbi:hypothetical protein AIOL_003656 [Candidatus Rhodobacter oscarellae]|uniref:Uncharacterized protein n=1 Tax=Candidatus Rhodobacter oscarellae TaxID=1675527 RepID=A0A0J9E7J9_9RHOB|nr:hypothetical protein AIOL_003656 [Candidatus Rhodobacter lobularis]
MDELRSALPGCDLCAYIDLDVALVMSLSAPQKPPQEQLDALAEMACVLLRSNPCPAEGDHASETEFTTFLTQDRSYFLMRSTGDPGEVICCRCGADVDPDAVEAGARLTLKWVGEAA